MPEGVSINPTIWEYVYLTSVIFNDVRRVCQQIAVIVCSWD